MSKAIAKKALSIASKVLVWIVVAVAVSMMIFTIFSTLTFDRNDRNLFGIRFYVVLTDSMSPSEINKDDKVHFNAGDIVMIKNVQDAKSLQPGDIIAFVSQNSDSFGATITHRIRERTMTEDGRLLGYVTYGTNTGTDDEALVEPDYVLGTYAGKLPRVGYFFEFLQTTPGYIICILVPFLLLILWQGVNTVRLFKQYKREQIADIEEERAHIAKEREESAQMLRELQALKAQIAQQQAQMMTANQATPQTEQPEKASEESHATPAEEVSTEAKDSSEAN